MNPSLTLGMEEAWSVRLSELLASSPIVKDVAIVPMRVHEDGPEGAVDFSVAGESHRLVVACKSSGQPRYVRDAIVRLGREISRSSVLTRGLVAAPFISPASRAILAENGMGWMDLAGNARVVFPRLHLEINKADRDPFATKRAQRSLFFPKSARILKLLLHSPQKSWKVAELVTEAGVSAGQVSNVRKALIEREWARAEVGGGLKLTEPDPLLDAWRDDGLQSPQVLMRGYTLKHGRALDTAIEDAFAEATVQNVRLLLASHSVARRVAPFARVSGEFFYADAGGFALLKRHLQLASTDKGENATIYGANDDGLWLETMALGPKIRATGLIQTYLDLLSTGERGREAAEHWRTEKITPMLQRAQ